MCVALRLGTLEKDKMDIFIKENPKKSGRVFYVVITAKHESFLLSANLLNLYDGCVKASINLNK